MIRVATAGTGQRSAVTTVLPAIAASPTAMRIKSIEAATPVPKTDVGSVTDSLELQLFNNAAAVKILFGDYLRHLSVEWRPVVFREIDRLLDPNAWNEESALIERASFATFLRFVDHALPGRVPSLGVSHDGSILAAWLSESLRLFVTFTVDDRVLATFVTRTDRGEDQITSWQGPVVALKERILREGGRACVGGMAR